MKTRTRQCQNGSDDNCAGSSSSERQCNLDDCEQSVVVYWENLLGFGTWNPVSAEELGLPGGDYHAFENKDAIPEICADYCFNVR